MNILEIARASYQRIVARRNGVPTADISDRKGKPESFSVGQPEAAPHRLIINPADLATVCAAVADSAQVAVDIETVPMADQPMSMGMREWRQTALDPHRGRVRLLSLGVDTLDEGRFAYLID